MFSKIEAEVLKFIKEKEFVTPKEIKEELGENAVGAIGKLIQNKKIEKISKWEDKDSYTRRLKKGYKAIKNEKEK